MPNNNELKKEESSIAMELLQEVKAQTKRWMIAFLVVVFLWAGTIGTFVWYLYQYDFSSYSQDGSGYNNINTGDQGDVNNGTEIPSAEEEKR